MNVIFKNTINGVVEALAAGKRTVKAIAATCSYFEAQTTNEYEQSVYARLSDCRTRKEFAAVIDTIDFNYDETKAEAPNEVNPLVVLMLKNLSDVITDCFPGEKFAIEFNKAGEGAPVTLDYIHYCSCGCDDEGNTANVIQFADMDHVVSILQCNGCSKIIVQAIYETAKNFASGEEFAHSCLVAPVHDKTIH